MWRSIRLRARTQREGVARLEKDRVLRLELERFEQVLAGFFAATGGVQQKTKRVMRVGTVGSEIEDRAEVRLSLSCVSARPEDLSEPHSCFGIIGAAIDNAREHRFGAGGVALIEAIERRFDLHRVAALLEGLHCLGSPLLARFAGLRRLEIVFKTGTTGSEKQNSDHNQKSNSD